MPPEGEGCPRCRQTVNSIHDAATGVFQHDDQAVPGPPEEGVSLDLPASHGHWARAVLAEAEAQAPEILTPFPLRKPI